MDIEYVSNDEYVKFKNLCIIYKFLNYNELDFYNFYIYLKDNNKPCNIVTRSSLSSLSSLSKDPWFLNKVETFIKNNEKKNIKDLYELYIDKFSNSKVLGISKSLSNSNVLLNHFKL
jgi:hypothetical protein